MYIVGSSQSPQQERHPDANQASVTVGDFAPGSWLRVPAGSILLQKISFGEAANYASAGGLPVCDDFSPDKNSFDIARIGLNVWTPDPQNNRATAAFTASENKIISLHATFARLKGTSGQSVRVRAGSGGQERIAETTITFPSADASVAEIDLPVRNLALDRVGITDEQWNWEIALAGDTWQKLAAAPIRIYITAAAPTSNVPRDSFYHVACAIGGATTPGEAQRSLWQYFRNDSRRGMTNARGKKLSMWKTAAPTNVHNDYVCRKAQGLVVHADSSCLGWAELLKEALAIHGIASKVKYIWVDESRLDLEIPTFNVHKLDGQIQTVHEVGLIVKSYRWSKDGSITAGISCGPNDVINAGDFRWKVNLIGNPVCLPWNSPDATLVGTPGWLGWGANAYGIYCNHAVVLIENEDGTQQWLDPSHAIGPLPNLLDYQRELLGDGEEDPGGLFAVVGCRLRKKRNPATGQEEVLCVGEIFTGAHPAPDYLCLKACEPN